MGFTVLWCIHRVKHLRMRRRKDNCLAHFPMTRMALQSRSTLYTYVVIFTLIYCYMKKVHDCQNNNWSLSVLWQWLYCVSTGGWAYSIQLCPLQISFKSWKPWIHLCLPSASAWPLHSLGNYLRLHACILRHFSCAFNALYSLYLLCTTVWPHSVYFAYQVSDIFRFRLSIMLHV